MPPLPPALATCKVVFSGTINLIPWANILHFAYNGAPPTNADLLTSLTATTNLGTVWNLNAAKWSGTDVHLTQISIQDLSSSTGAGAATGFSFSGTRSGPTPTASSCLLVKWSIPRRYRGGHPRSYFPGGGQADQLDSRTWTTTLVGIGNTFVPTFISGLTSALPTGSAPWTHVNVSYHSGHALRPTAQIDTITGFTVEQLIASQRRRLGH